MFFATVQPVAIEKYILFTPALFNVLGIKTRQAVCAQYKERNGQKMKTKKRFFAFFLAVITVFTFSVQISAAGPESAEPLSPIAAEHVDHSTAISPRRGCTVCTVGSMITICEKERHWDHVGQHDVKGKRCVVNYFRSGGHYLCDTCGATRPLDYADEFGGEHLCVEIHGACGIGVKSICSLGYTPPSPPFPSNEEITEE